MAFMEAGFGGSLGGQFRLRVNVDVIGQEQGNNRSLIRYTAWLERVQSSGGSAPFNYSTTYGNTNINGHNPQRAIGGYIWPVNEVGRRYYLAQNEDYWIYHDGAGNANPVFGANFDMANSPLITSAAVAQNVGMPHINRYANIDGFNVDWTTDEAIRIAWHSDSNVSAISWWSSGIDGGAHHDEGSGGQGWFVKELHNLASQTTYDFKVAVQRADSGLWTESGTLYATTLAQNNFFGIL
jgi:hypothetical protein